MAFGAAVLPEGCALGVDDARRRDRGARVARDPRGDPEGADHEEQEERAEDHDQDPRRGGCSVAPRARDRGLRAARGGWSMQRRRGGSARRGRCAGVEHGRREGVQGRRRRDRPRLDRCPEGHQHLVGRAEPIVLGNARRTVHDGREPCEILPHGGDPAVARGAHRRGHDVRDRRPVEHDRERARLLEDEPHREDVGGGAHRTVHRVPLLGRAVARREARRRPGPLARHQRPRHAEVEDLRRDGAVRVPLHHDVLWLDVAVDDAPRVRERERLQHRDDDLRELEPAEGRRLPPDALLDGDIERDPVEPLEHDVGHLALRAVDLPGVVHPDDPGVRQAEEEARLAKEVGVRHRVERGLEALDRDGLIEHRLPTRVDDPEPAFSEEALDAVLAADRGSMRPKTSCMLGAAGGPGDNIAWPAGPAPTPGARTPSRPSPERAARRTSARMHASCTDRDRMRRGAPSSSTIGPVASP